VVKDDRKRTHNSTREHMSQKSDIEWTDGTWNPTRGCKKISPGCKYCYAERNAERFRGVPGNAYEQGFDPRLVPEKLPEPLRWTKQMKIFVNSMSDLFLDEFPLDYIETVTRVMAAANWHTFQVLTKRHERMRELLTGPLGHVASLPHIWWGVSVENKRHGLPRVEALRHTPVKIRFLSIEPLIEDLGEVDLTGIHWVIVGGESGPRSRPMRSDWVRSLRDQCGRASVPFFFKQWGGINKKKTGRVLDGRTHDDMPEIPLRPVPSKQERHAIERALGLGEPRRWALEVVDLLSNEVEAHDKEEDDQ
jgi:protein gp37